jgi:hypothetical protein
VFSSELVLLTNKVQLDAQLSYFIASGSSEVQAGKSYAVYNVFNIVRTDMLDKEGSPAGSPLLYADAVQYGWKLSVLIEGESKTFTNEVKVALEAAGASGRMKEAVEKFNLHTRVKAEGLRLKEGSGVPIVTDAKQISEIFEIPQEPVAIFVDYLALSDVVTPEIIQADAPILGLGQYRLSSFLASISKTKSNGQRWDFGSGPSSAPDPFVNIIINGELWATCNEKDSFEATCDERKGQSFKIVRDTRICVQIFDQDLASNDLIGNTSCVRILDVGKVGAVAREHGRQLRAQAQPSPVPPREGPVPQLDCDHPPPRNDGAEHGHRHREEEVETPHLHGRYSTVAVLFPF